ncbi:hypothetical protein [Nostoc sp.]
MSFILSGKAEDRRNLSLYLPFDDHKKDNKGDRRGLNLSQRV